MNRNPWWAVLLLALLVGRTVPAAAATVVTADDVCPPDADPCMVDSRVFVDDSAALDFGQRTLRITGRGTLDTGAGFLDLSCGGLVVEPGGTLDLVGTPADFFDGGHLRIAVLGSCDNAPATTCTGDADCGGGQCLGGDADLSGRILGRAHWSADLRLQAAGNVRLGGTMDFRSRTPGLGAAGILEVEAGGSIDLLGSFRGRGKSAGGIVDLAAAGDVRVSDLYADLRGGDNAGGGLYVGAGRDAVVSGSFRMGSTSGGGDGGDVRIAAGRDVTITAGTDGSPSLFDVRGHSGQFFGAPFPGSGGDFEVTAGRGLAIGPSVEVAAGGGSGGFGGTATLEAAGDVTLDAKLDLSTAGKGSAGGDLTVNATTGVLHLGPASRIDLGGGSAGGSASLASGGNLAAEGEIASTGSWRPGWISLVSSADVSVSGLLRAEATPDTYMDATALYLEGCDITVMPGGSLVDDSNGWNIELVAHEFLRAAAGSSVLAPGSVSRIRVRYRDPGQPPSLLGTVTPAATVVLDDTLSACP